MTVIAWDGYTLAADKMGDMGGASITLTKIYEVNGHLVGFSGSPVRGQALLKWFRDGAEDEKFPTFEKDDDSFTRFVVINPHKEIWVYEQSPSPFKVEDKFYACGSGRDFALAALQMGMSAEKSVELTNHLCNTCGRGIDVLEFDF